MLAFTNLGIIRMYIVQLEITILLDLTFIRVCSTTIGIRASTTTAFMLQVEDSS